MKKKVEEIKFFQKKLYYKRFYKISFTNAILQISETANSDPLKTKVIPFREITSIKIWSEKNELIE